MEEVVFGVLRMSLTGSTLFIILRILFQIFKDYITTFWQYTMRICCVFFFIVPFAPIRWIVKQINDVLLGADSEEFIHDMSRAAGYNADLPIDLWARQWTERIFGIITYITYIWMIGVFLFLVWQLFCFIRYKKIISESKPLPEGELRTLIEQCVAEERIKRKVEFLQNGTFKTPMFTGFTKPKIIFPFDMELNSSSKFIVKHEVTHLLHRDVLIKVMCMLIRAVHWFNPLVYILCNETDSWSEWYCDECVAKELTGQEKKQYALAILESLEMEDRRLLTFNSAFKDSKTNFQRRIMYMMKNKRPKRVLSLVVSLALLFCGVSTVYAEEVALSNIKSTAYLDNGVRGDTSLETGAEASLVLKTKADTGRAMQKMSVEIQSNTIYTFNWTVNAMGSTRSAPMMLSKGEQVAIATVWKDASFPLKIGISDGITFYYYDATGGNFSAGIKVPKTGSYCILIENWNNTAVTTSGSYTIN